MAESHVLYSIFNTPSACGGELHYHISPFVLAGCGSNDVKKAKDFITVGMYPQAMELLKKRIGENPKDAEAQFLLGSCYIHTDNLSGAGY